MSSDDYPDKLAPSGIGEAAKYNFSPWFIKLRFQNQDPIKGRFWKRATKPLSPIQARIGNEFEASVYDKLESRVRENIDEWYDWGDDKNKEQLIEKIEEVENSSYDKPIMMTQVRLSGEIGEFNIIGDADLVLLFSTNDGVQINVIDIKSSWDEKPSQQLQTATYTRLIRQILTDYDIEYEIKGGILYRETEIDDVVDTDKVPSFNTRSREGDVSRVLSQDGPFARAFDSDYDEIPLVVDKKSPFAEVTAVRAIEEGDLGILGLTQGEKERLNQKGIDNIEDLASLYKRIDDPRPYNFDEPDINDDMTDVVNSLKEDSGLSSRVALLSYKAQSILGEFNPDHEYAHEKPWMPWIPGTGSGNLPEDDPPYQADLPIRRNSMIRTYIDVQHDHVRDEVVTVSGVVTSGLYDGEPLEFSVTADKIVRDPNTWRSRNEMELLEEFISEMYDTIDFLADFAGHGANTPLHFYFYDNMDLDNLYESVIRHEEDSQIIESFRGLLDSREGIDQPMVSVVHDDIKSRMALKDMDTSLPALVERTYPEDDNNKIENDDWMYRDENGNEVDLKVAYEDGIFDTDIPIKYGEGSYSVLNENDNNRDYDSFYKIVPMEGSQIPVEYLWASEDIDILDPTWSDKSRQKRMIESFQWVDKDKKNVRMDSDMFSSLSRTFAKCLLHVERSIKYRNTDIKKSKISIPRMREKKSDTGDLSQACFEYLDLESYQTEKDAYDVYSEPLKKRVVEGESMPMIVTGVEEDKGYMFKVSGKLLLEEIGVSNPREIAGSSKLAGSDSTTGGSRCVATPLVSTSNGYDVAVDNPKSIATSTKVSIEDYDPDNQTIVIKGYRASRRSENRYTKSRIPWTLDGSENGKQYMGPGQSFVLDPSPDNTMAEKSIKALNNTSNNKVYRDIKQFREGSSAMDDSIFDRENCSDYIDYVEPALEFRPNRKQRKYIKNTATYSLLQGPPGTGKTSGAISHAALSRAYDMEIQEKHLTGLVTGLSNKSIDEVMERISEIKYMMDKQFGDHPLENLRMVRLAYGKPDDPVKGVEYLSYQNDTHLEKLRGMLFGDGGTRQTTLSSTTGSNEHVIIFATPGRIDGLMDNIDEERRADEVYEDSDSFFDLITIDEASMMPMYQLFMVSGFISDDGQVLVGGDHRQLPPVQTYEWSEEKKKSIQTHVPHLSVLDYFRYIRGEDVMGTFDLTPESPNIDIPMIRLEKTYRCHKVVTDFLRESVYKKDRIPYYSEQDDLISLNNPRNKNIEDILNPEYPMTLIIHDERSSQQFNLTEEDLISTLLDEIPSEYSSGIVTPHNAQKGKLRVSCPDSTVDTVERFQGGEKDIMFVSTTVSDPDHLSKEEDFILSENRLNVALSRMKKKLVVVASRSIFEMVPSEVETYDEAVIWKSLYEVAENNGDLSYSGEIANMGGESSYNIDVYNIDKI